MDEVELELRVTALELDVLELLLDLSGLLLLLLGELDDALEVDELDE